MKYAVIAAGEGSRLAGEGIEVPKPLVRIGGECLIDRLIRVFMNNGATEIVVICNGVAIPVSRHLEHISKEGLDGRPVPLRFVVKNTAGSMHSFYEISSLLKDGPFCLTTVDTVFRENDFSEYISEFRRLVDGGMADGLMGVTGYVDDEKPLFVGVGDNLDVTGFYDEENGCRFVSGGIYGLVPAAIDVLEGCMARGTTRMRDFQRAMVAGGMRLRAYAFDKILDIDHASDIAKAEDFIKSSMP